MGSIITTRNVPAPLSTWSHPHPPSLIHNQKSGPVINKAVTKLRSVCNNDIKQHTGTQRNTEEHIIT